MSQQPQQQDEEELWPRAHGFAALKSLWARRESRNKPTPPPPPPPAVVDNSSSALLNLPSELLFLICCSEEIKARDLVALGLTCSRFGRGASSSLIEHAARTKVMIMMMMRDKNNHKRFETLQSVNFKTLLHYMQEDAPIPVFSCPACNWKVGGFRCEGRRPTRLVRAWEPCEDERNYQDAGEEKGYEVPPVPVPSGCGCYLMWNEALKVLFCPAGCGSLTAPACSCKAYVSKEKWDENELLFEVMTRLPPPPPATTGSLPLLVPTRASLEEPLLYLPKEHWLKRADAEEYEDGFRAGFVPRAPICRKTPPMTCICCGYTVGGYACLGRDGNPRHPPSPAHPLVILQESFYENVWCSYRWKCMMQCAVMRCGPEDDEDLRRRPRKDSALLSCVSRNECNPHDGDGEAPKKGTEMAALEWLDTLGPPTNYYEYRPVKVKPSN